MTEYTKRLVPSFFLVMLILTRVRFYNIILSFSFLLLFMQESGEYDESEETESDFSE